MAEFMAIFKSYEKKFVLLGDRHYVQGSTLTDGLFKAIEFWELGSIKHLRTNIHSILKEHGRYDLYKGYERPIPIEKNYNALFYLSCDTGTYAVGLKGNGECISERQPYDEESLIDGYRIIETTKSAVLMIQPDSQIINIMIALNKKLVNGLFSGAGYSQWFLSRYDLSLAETHMNRASLLEIKIIGTIGLSHIHGSIALEGKTVGSIYFSRNKS
jgi:hypothetical protein